MLFYTEQLLYGQKKGIGLCTLWTPKEKYHSQLPFVEVIGNLYAHYGIGILIRNVLATPSISAIVVTGTDSPSRFLRQADKLLKGQLNAQELFLSEENIRDFYDHVDLYDARSISLHEQEKLSAFLHEIKVTRKQRQARIIPLPEVTTSTYPTHRSVHVIREDSISSAHLAILNEVRTFGQLREQERSGVTRQELWQLITCLSEQTNLKSIPFYSDLEVQEYGEELWRGSSNKEIPEGISYRYGYLMHHKYGNQVDRILSAWEDNPTNYATVITLWGYESYEMDTPPCLIIVHPQIRQGILDMVAYFRAQEVYRAWPMNVAGLRYFQGKLSEQAKVRIGELTIISGSAQIYDRDFPNVDLYLRKQFPSKARIAWDAKGNWNFSKQGDNYIIEHFSDEKLLQRWECKSIREVEKRVTPFIGSVSHALYIGRQIEKLVNE